MNRPEEKNIEDLRQSANNGAGDLLAVIANILLDVRDELRIIKQNQEE